MHDNPSVLASQSLRPRRIRNTGQCKEGKPLFRGFSSNTLNWGNVDDLVGETDDTQTLRSELFIFSKNEGLRF
jgi:hypothetical protein